MRGGRTPFILAVLALGFLYLLYIQQESWLPPTYTHLLDTEDYSESNKMVPLEYNSSVPGFCEYCGPEDTYCKRYG